MGLQYSKPIDYKRSPENAPKVKNIAEDVSKLFYDIPKRKDMAICFVYFNPVGTKRMLMNYFYTTEKLKLAKIPYYTLEVYYDRPEIADAIHMKGSSKMFYKERLCHLMEKHIPWRYSKLMFLDSDVIFGNSKWYDETSELLTVCDVVQPFSSAVWLDIRLKECIQERISAVFMDPSKPYESKNHHPGFGWAFKRSWFKKYGYFQYAITGSGDTLSFASWIGVEFTSKGTKAAYKVVYDQYCNKPLPVLSCTHGNVYHLWHGTRQNRKYVERHTILEKVKDIRDILIEDENGLLVLTDSEIQDKLINYFVTRDDDGY
jgi:hypothetical protein